MTTALRYLPYGGHRNGPAGLQTDRLFTSQTWDDSSGLYWYASRAYDPAIGRFVCPDTIVPEAKNPQSLNRYAYCGNNPVKYVDPSGHAYILDEGEGGPGEEEPPQTQPLWCDVPKYYLSAPPTPVACVDVPCYRSNSPALSPGISASPTSEPTASPAHPGNDTAGLEIVGGTYTTVSAMFDQGAAGLEEAGRFGEAASVRRTATGLKMLGPGVDAALTYVKERDQGSGVWRSAGIAAAAAGGALVAGEIGAAQVAGLPPVGPFQVVRIGVPVAYSLLGGGFAAYEARQAFDALGIR